MGTSANLHPSPGLICACNTSDHKAEFWAGIELRKYPFYQFLLIMACPIRYNTLRASFFEQLLKITYPLEHQLAIRIMTSKAGTDSQDSLLFGNSERTCIRTSRPRSIGVFQESNPGVLRKLIVFRISILWNESPKALAGFSFVS